MLLPHQHRLDWQMWFAALGSYQYNPWLLSLVFRLLEGRQEVLELLHMESPFINRQKPPKFIRAKLYKYHFTESGPDWWRREEQGEYLPELSLDNDQLKDILKSQGIIGHKSESKIHKVKNL